MLQCLLIGRFFISPVYAILCFHTIPPFKSTFPKKPPSIVFGLHLVKLYSSLITAGRTSHSGNNHLFSSLSSLSSLSFLDQHHPLQALVGFGFLHNSPPTCSVLLSSLQPPTLNTTKFIVTLSSSPVRVVPSFCRILSPSALHGQSTCPCYRILCAFTNLATSSPPICSYNSAL
jgi:hypothetical protein